MHGIPKLLSLILLWAIVLPQSGQSVNSDPAFPDFTKAADIQRLVYGSFRQALFGTDTSMTFANALSLARDMETCRQSVFM